MAKKKNNNKNPKKRKNAAKVQTEAWFSSFREGKPLSVDFFKRHGWFILIAMVAVIALIGQRYTNKSKMREIKELTRELAFEKSQQINEKATYMSLIRENEMRRLLRERNIDLDYQEQPPYELSRH